MVPRKKRTKSIHDRLLAHLLLNDWSKTAFSLNSSNFFWKEQTRVSFVRNSTRAMVQCLMMLPQGAPRVWASTWVEKTRPQTVTTAIDYINLWISDQGIWASRDRTAPHCIHTEGNKKRAEHPTGRGDSADPQEARTTPGCQSRTDP